MPGRLPHWILPDDPTDRRQFAVVLGWLGFGGLPIGGAAILEAWRRGWIPTVGLVAAFPLLVVALILLGRLLFEAIARSAQGLVTTVLSARGIAGPESTSAEEALVMAGRVDDAMASYRRRIEAAPKTVTLRLELARLYQRQNDPENAIRLLQEIRAVAGTEYETVVGNGLIDLLERIGDRGRRMTEYARFAAHHRGTTAGDAARRRLAELRADLGHPPSS